MGTSSPFSRVPLMISGGGFDHSGGFGFREIDMVVHGVDQIRLGEGHGVVPFLSDN
jgi:hypothetical protein